jgi:hypothetical protein
MRYKSIPKLTTEQIGRFWERIDVHQPAGCWEWRGAQIKGGYGQFATFRHGGFMAHRVAYELLIGPIAQGMQLDHLCRNRLCCNPDHLQPVSAMVNTHRGHGPAGENAKKTHCKNGHAFTPENTFYFPSQHGRRTCRTCWQARSASASSRESARRRWHDRKQVA